MIFETLKIETTLDFSLIFIILGAITFYFGKLISEVQSTKENKYANYVAGVFFTLIYLLLPLMLIFQFEKIFLFIPYTFWWTFGIFVFQSMLFYIIHLKINMFKIQKNEFEDTYRGEVLKHSKSIYSKINLNFDVDKTLNLIQKVFVKRLSDKSLFILIFLMTIITTNIILKSGNLVLQLIFFIYYVLGISNIAILYSWNQVKKYQKVNIILENKKEIEGKLIKIEEEYITIRTKEKIIHLNKDKVIAIEKIQNAPIINPTPLENIVDSVMPKPKNTQNQLNNKGQSKK